MMLNPLKLKIENMRRKNKTKILAYLLFIVVVVYWFFIFHSSSTLRKVGSEENDYDEEDFQIHQRLHSGSMKFFKTPKFSMEDLGAEIRNQELKEKVSDMLSGLINVPSHSKSESDNHAVNESKVRVSMFSAMGLTFMNRQFYLNGKPFRIFSGSIHYFRVAPGAWRDRLLKLKACGLNTVETYVPWNLHEPSPGVYNFEGILDVRSFLKMANELGLYVIFRPGPYICSEMDFGGLPGWLLADPYMKVRSNYKGYIKAVARYFTILLEKIIDFQFTEGGPIIMVQVENEYAVYGEDTDHLKILTFMLRNAGIRELLVTSDNDYSRPEMYFHDYALPTVNFRKFHWGDYEIVTRLNPHFPFMAMELWTGWFTSWGDYYKAGRPIADLNATIQQVLDLGGSFNLYMFHGGTNFGFTAGAGNETADHKFFVTSYDYDALLTESGDITAKYMAVRQIMQQFYKTIGIFSLPPIPPDTPKMAYGRLVMEEQLSWKSIITSIPVAESDNRITYMEHYGYNRPSGNPSILDLPRPSMGYVIYSSPNIKYQWDDLPGIQIIGYVKDRLLAVLSNQLFGVVHGPNSQIDPRLEYDWDTHFNLDTYEFYWDHGLNYEELFNRHDWRQLMALEILKTMKKIAKGRDFIDNRLDLVVENLGRVAYSKRETDLFNVQRKGLKGPVFSFLQGHTFRHWDIRFLHFSAEQCRQLSNSSRWTPFNTDPDAKDTTLEGRTKPVLDDAGVNRLLAPTLFRTTLTLEKPPQDTFIYLRGWIKGVVIVNGFNLGRYWNIGPQISLYLPADMLHIGKNEFLIFEEEAQGGSILLSARPFLGMTSN